jgi:hypothetical protein
MGLSLAGNTGTFETNAETISKLIENNWDIGIVAKPVFYTDEDETNYDRFLEDHEEAIAVVGGTSIERTDISAGDMSQIGEKEMLEIVVQAGSEKKRKQYELAIKTVLVANHPSRNNGTPIPKGNGTGNSPIQWYDEFLPTFIPYNADDNRQNDQEGTSKSSGTLNVVYSYSYS